jgi:hypothetical protein
MYPENRREFFEIYARDHEFNPYDSSSWYSQPFDRILSREVFFTNSLFLTLNFELRFSIRCFDCIYTYMVLDDFRLLLYNIDFGVFYSQRVITNDIVAIYFYLIQIGSTASDFTPQRQYCKCLSRLVPSYWT